MIDVAVVGGGAAGLAAAVALARSLRTVTVIDAGHPRNAPAEGAHNVLGQEGVAPLELLAKGRREAIGYGATIVEGSAVGARRVDGGFELDLTGGDRITARRLLLATGLRDERPDVPGLTELWGRDVLHCPYCHGYEVRGKRIAVLATGPFTEHQALLFRQLSDRVVVVRHGADEFEPATSARFAARGIEVVDGPARELRIEDGRLRAVVLDTGEIEADAVVVAPRFIANADLYRALGGTTTAHPMGEFIATGMNGKTDLDGVWAAGNVAELSAMVVGAAASGISAAAGVNAELAFADAEMY